jgi:hypothetical protein
VNFGSPSIIAEIPYFSRSPLNHHWGWASESQHMIWISAAPYRGTQHYLDDENFSCNLRAKSLGGGLTFGCFFVQKNASLGPRGWWWGEATMRDAFWILDRGAGVHPVSTEKIIVRLGVHFAAPPSHHRPRPSCVPLYRCCCDSVRRSVTPPYMLQIYLCSVQVR